MSSSIAQQFELKRLYESSLEIIEERNLYNIQRVVRKGSKDGFHQFLRQSFDTEIYNRWWRDAQAAFAKVGLNFLKFKKQIFLREPDEINAIFPPGYLLLASEELENILADSTYLKNYQLTAETKQVWPSIQYSNGIVENGMDIHDFNRFKNLDAIAMLSALWEKREILSPTKTVIKQPQLLSWSDTGCKSEESGKATANAINKAMRDKGISLRVKYPKSLDGVYLRAQQESTN